MNLQSRLFSWVIQTFGLELAMCKKERTRRFLEESLELVQATGCPKEIVLAMVDYVYDRPVGDVPQEIAGSALTLFALAQAYGFDVNEVTETEMIRIENNADAIREKNLAKPR